MSLAPSSTERLSRGFSSMADTRASACPRGVFRWLVRRRLRPRPKLSGSRQALDQLHRGSPGALGLPWMGYVAEHQLLEHAPGDRQAHDREHGARVAIEGLLRSPAGM